MNNEEKEAGLQAQTKLPRYKIGGQPEGPGELSIKFPRPAKQSKLKNDTRARKERSKHQERELAKSARRAGFQAAKRVPGSGALAGLPADVDYGKWFLGEAKETRTGRLTIDPEWVKKISSQAKQIGRPWWALHAWVGEEAGPYKKVVILDEDHFFQLIGHLNDLG